MWFMFFLASAIYFQFKRKKREPRVYAYPRVGCRTSVELLLKIEGFETDGRRVFACGCRDTQNPSGMRLCQAHNSIVEAAL